MHCVKLRKLHTRRPFQWQRLMAPPRIYTCTGGSFMGPFMGSFMGFNSPFLWLWVCACFSLYVGSYPTGARGSHRFVVVHTLVDPHMHLWVNLIYRTTCDASKMGKWLCGLYNLTQCICPWKCRHFPWPLHLQWGSLDQQIRIKMTGHSYALTERVALIVMSQNRALIIGTSQRQQLNLKIVRSLVGNSLRYDA